MKDGLEARIGKLAREFGGVSLPLLVLKSTGGFYLGTSMAEGPFTRESEEYWTTGQEASTALEIGDWTQRRSL